MSVYSHFENVSTVVSEVGPGCNLACEGCQGDGRDIGVNTEKLFPLITAQDLAIIHDVFPNLEEFRWGGVWSEPTLEQFSLHILNTWVMKNTQWNLVTITNGLSLLEQDSERFVLNTLGYDRSSTRTRVVFSIDPYHRDSYLRQGGTNTEYKRMVSGVNKLAKSDLVGSIGVNMMVAHEGEVESGLRFLHNCLSLASYIDVGVLTLSVYSAIQEKLLNRGAVDLRSSNGLPDPTDPVAFVRRERKTGLTFYSTIADMGFRRNGVQLDG